MDKADAAKAIKDGKPFRLRKTAVTGAPIEYWAATDNAGDLPEPYLSSFIYARPKYVIFSYATPIAWATSPDGQRLQWTIPNVRYSLTTTRHHNEVRQILQMTGHEIEAIGPEVNLRKGHGQAGIYGERTWK